MTLEPNFPFLSLLSLSFSLFFELIPTFSLLFIYIQNLRYTYLELTAKVYYILCCIAGWKFQKLKYLSLYS